MKFLFWLSFKLLFGNIKKALLPYIGITVGVAALIVALTLGAGGERLITNNLMAIGDNRIVLGGDSFDQRDIRLLDNYPFVEYSFFPDARVVKGENIFIGYPKRALQKLKFPKLRNGEAIVDINQFPRVKEGETLSFYIGNRMENFRVAKLYVEENPFELTKQGNRIIISQDYFSEIFNRYRYNELVISLDKSEDSEVLIPILLKKFNNDRISYKEVKILEKPEVYKKVVKIQKIVKNTLYILVVVSFILSGVGIMTLINGNIQARTMHIGVFRAIGIPKNSIVKVFLIEGIIISFLGMISGGVIGTLITILGGKLIFIPPVFKIEKIVFLILMILITGIIVGILPTKRIDKINVVDILRKN